MLVRQILYMCEIMKKKKRFKFAICVDMGVEWVIGGWNLG